MFGMVLNTPLKNIFSKILNFYMWMLINGKKALSQMFDKVLNTTRSMTYSLFWYMKISQIMKYKVLETETSSVPANSSYVQICQNVKIQTVCIYAHRINWATFHLISWPFYAQCWKLPKKSCGVNNLKLLKYVWPFFNIMEGLKEISSVTDIS